MVLHMSATGQWHCAPTFQEKWQQTWCFYRHSKWDTTTWGGRRESSVTSLQQHMC